MFCAPGLIFGGIESVGSRFNVLRTQTHFWRYRGRRVPFSCFALPKLFSAVPGRRLPFSYFAWPYSFSKVPRASGPVFMFCATSTHFRRYRGRQVPFSYFALPDSFSAVPRASGSVFMFCAPVLVFDSTEGVGSRFHVLRAGLVFGGIGGDVSRFHVLCRQTRFRRCRVRRVPFSCFARLDSFPVVPRASGPVFMFCASGLVFGGTEGVGSRIHVLRSRTRFRRYRRCQVPFSYFALRDSFSAVPRA
jgi:hypothetical protein